MLNSILATLTQCVTALVKEIYTLFTVVYLLVESDVMVSTLDKFPNLVIGSYFILLSFVRNSACRRNFRCYTTIL